MRIPRVIRRLGAALASGLIVATVVTVFLGGSVLLLSGVGTLIGLLLNGAFDLMLWVFNMFGYGGLILATTFLFVFLSASLFSFFDG